MQGANGAGAGVEAAVSRVLGWVRPLRQTGSSSQCNMLVISVASAYSGPYGVAQPSSCSQHNGAASATQVRALSCFPTAPQSSCVYGVMTFRPIVSLRTRSLYLLTLRDRTLHWTRTPKRIHARKKMSARQAASSCQTTHVPHQQARLLTSNITRPETSVSPGRLRMPHGI